MNARDKGETTGGNNPAMSGGGAATPPPPTALREPPSEDFLVIFEKAIRQNSRSDGWASLAHCRNYIRARFPEFSDQVAGGSGIKSWLVASGTVEARGVYPDIFVRARRRDEPRYHFNNKGAKNAKNAKGAAPEADEEEGETAPPPLSADEITDILKDVVTKNADDDGWVSFADCARFLREHYMLFDPAAYGGLQRLFAERYAFELRGAYPHFSARFRREITLEEWAANKAKQDAAEAKTRAKAKAKVVAAAAKVSAPAAADIPAVLRRAVAQSAGSGGWAAVGDCEDFLRHEFSAFAPRDYGAESLAAMLRADDAFVVLAQAGLTAVCLRGESPPAAELRDALLGVVRAARSRTWLPVADCLAQARAQWADFAPEKYGAADMVALFKALDFFFVLKPYKKGQFLVRARETRAQNGLLRDRVGEAIGQVAAAVDCRGWAPVGLCCRFLARDYGRYAFGFPFDLRQVFGKSRDSFEVATLAVGGDDESGVARARLQVPGMQKLVEAVLFRRAFARNKLGANGDDADAAAAAVVAQLANAEGWAAVDECWSLLSAAYPDLALGSDAAALRAKFADDPETFELDEVAIKDDFVIHLVRLA